MKRNIISVPVERIEGIESAPIQDLVAVEEPLEIRIGGKPVSVTMRTPGSDAELAAGFLFGEGILRGPQDIGNLKSTNANVVDITLSDGVDFEAARLERHFFMSSSCGVCGKASIETVHAAGCAMLPRNGLLVRRPTIHGLPTTLRRAQPVFEHTGGLHAAALFDASGALCALREDVGRHNAVDKVIGGEVLAGRTPLAHHILMVSGRASFELVQKAVMARVPVLAAVGAPSSLAVQLAHRFGMTLLGFVRDDRFNIYAGGWRIE